MAAGMTVVTGIPAEIEAFLSVATPAGWVERAVAELPVLLIDHANCELKAASTAMAMIHRYPDRGALADRMSRLAREELRHYEQVRKLMGALGVGFRRLSASRYASGLREGIRAGEPDRLLDSLLVGAIIEARSCERFAAVAPCLPAQVGEFYRGLLASEARHFQNYLALARQESGRPSTAIEQRLDELLALEAGLITNPDPQFRFHSGLPTKSPAIGSAAGNARAG